MGILIIREKKEVGVEEEGRGNEWGGAGAINCLGLGQV